MGLPTIALGMSGKDPFLKMGREVRMDNFLNLEEFLNAAETIFHPPITDKEEVKDLFEKLDANKDQLLDADEFYGRYNKRRFPDDETTTTIADASTITDEGNASPRDEDSSSRSHG